MEPGGLVRIDKVRLSFYSLDFLSFVLRFLDISRMTDGFVQSDTLLNTFTKF